MHIFIAHFEDELYQFSENVLKEYHQVLPLPEDDKLLPYFKSNPVDAFLLTIEAGDTKAFRTYDILRRIPRVQHKPILFLAKELMEDVEKRALLDGVDDFLTMPVTPQLLLHRVNTLMQLANLRKRKNYADTYEEEISVIFAELMECRDMDTGDHLKNTTKYFKILLNEAYQEERYKDIISEEDYHDVVRSAMLHDIGKIGILDGILRKETTLDYDEFEHMKTHTTLGKQAFDKIILETGGSKWLYLARDMAYYHHERWDGSGYPDCLKGEEIPFYARMLTIADVYDALTSDRIYKQAYSHEKAVEMIREGRGTYYDPDLVDLFIKVNKRFEEQLNFSRFARR